MAEHDEIYGKERAERLEAALRELSARLAELDAAGLLLKSVPELLRRLGASHVEIVELVAC